MFTIKSVVTVLRLIILSRQTYFEMIQFPFNIIIWVYMLFNNIVITWCDFQSMLSSYPTYSYYDHYKFIFVQKSLVLTISQCCIEIKNMNLSR